MEEAELDSMVAATHCDCGIASLDGGCMASILAGRSEREIVYEVVMAVCDTDYVDSNSL